MIWNALVFVLQVAGALVALGLLALAAIMCLLIAFHIEQKNKSDTRAVKRKSPGLTSLSERLAQNPEARRWFEEQEIQAAKSDLEAMNQLVTNENIENIRAKWHNRSHLA